MVQRRTIDRVLGTLSAQRIPVGYTLQAGPDAYDVRIGEDMDRLGQDLWAMNRAAVNARYALQEPAPDYGTYEGHYCSLIQGTKALECLLYQCSEGDVTAWPLFLAMHAVHVRLLSRIVSELPEWEDAEWG